MAQIRFFHHPDFSNANGPIGYERTPQQPLEGQPVTVAAAVEGCSELALKTSVDGICLPDITGRFVCEEGGRRFFAFELGGFAYGSHVEYSFTAGAEKSRSYGFDTGREIKIDAFRQASVENGCLRIELDNPWLERFFIYLTEGRLVLSAQCSAGQGLLIKNGESYIYSDTSSACSVDVNPEQASLTITSKDGKPVMQDLTLVLRHTRKGLTGFTFSYKAKSKAVFGLGERYSGVNHIGRKLGCMVADHFTNQGKSTYFPLPFYYGNDGHGVFVDTPCQSEFDFGSTQPGRFTLGARIGASGTLPDIHVFYGTPKEIISGFTALSGRPNIPPKWAFGLWVSANRWNCQGHIREQLKEIRAIGYPANVVVIEAWSDEATFYIWNDAEYQEKNGSEAFALCDFTYRAGGRWPDPAAMIKELHGSGIRLVLWQIPVLKKLGSEEPANAQLAEDTRYAIENGLCALDGAGGAYSIPDFWFGGSKIPDFTQEKTREWWFSKRRHLLDMGVDGFKTDGGEFVYEDGCTFADGSTGIEMKNGYAASYLNAYTGFAGKDRPLFSRAGNIGSQRHPIHWAGDQQSTWQEMRSVLNAGLSLGMSGAPFWSFDTGGFAGPLPTAELYIRSTELAAFAPVMQWHSEPMGGQFAGTPGRGVNDRSPWNIARATGDPSVIKISLFYAWLHTNLLPQLYSEAQKSACTGLPMMRQLAVEYPGDPAVFSMADQFMLGDLMAAPVTVEGAAGRDVYLPEGIWMDVWSGLDYIGGQTIHADAPIGRIPLYLRHGGALALELDEKFGPGKPVEPGKSKLSFLIAGCKGEYSFIDDEGIGHDLSWNGSGIKLSGKPDMDLFILSAQCLSGLHEFARTEFFSQELFVYKT